MLLRSTCTILACIVALLVPTSSWAACPTQKVDELKNLMPISSHYTEKLVERIEAGITYTPPNPSTGTNFLDSIFAPIWNWYIKNAVSDTVNVYQQDVLQSRNLEEVSACLHTDILIVEALMEDIRCELNEAYANDDGQRIFILKRVLHFAQDGLSALLAGASNPFYQDTQWGRLQLWDETDTVYCRMPQFVEDDHCKNCCEQTTKEECITSEGTLYYKEFGLQTCLADGGTLPAGEPDPGPGLCPFTSDYLPPVTVGYGCDLETLQSIRSQAPNLDPIAREYDGLEQLINDRDAFIEQASPIKEQRLKIDEFMNKEPIDLSDFGLGKSSERTHAQIAGCMDPIQIGTATSSGTINFNPLYVSGATITEIRGPFWFSKNEPKLARMLLEKAAFLEQYRELPDYLKTEYQLTEASTSTLSIIEGMQGLMNQGMRMIFGTSLEKSSINQAQDRASTYSYTGDSPLQLQEAFSSIRATIQKLSSSITENESGMRKFATGFSWYLRRSCTERPCNETLDRVLKILLTDECFPYIDGSYKGEDAYQNCKDAADL